MEFRLDRARSGGAALLAVHGDFDIATAPEFAAAVDRELTAAPSRLVVDLTPTTFADSSACRALLQAADATGAAGTSMRLVCPSANRHVRRVLDLLQIGDRIPLTEGVEDAAQSGPDGGAPA